MNRWERLMMALGVNSAVFELEHAAKFDLSVESWLRERLAELDQDDEVIRDVPCSKPCCVEAKNTEPRS